MKLLVVEDEPDFARILYDLAHDLDYRCLVALTAGDAFDKRASEIARQDIRPVRRNQAVARPTRKAA